MKHLTDEQLSARLDGMLSGREREDADAHLASCDACRARLAEAGALEERLERSLTHDPGDAYFESFAERVAARIAAEGGSAHARDEGVPRRPRSLWSWLLTPRGMSLAGSTAALLLVAGVAWMRFHDRPEGMQKVMDSAPSRVGSTLREQAAPAPPAEQERPAPSILESATPQATDPLATDAAPAPAPGAGPARAREVRPNAAGEPVPVRTVAPPAPSRDAGSTSTMARMKQKAAGPATDAKSQDQGARSQGAPAPAPAPPEAQSTPQSATAPQALSAAPSSKRAAGTSSNEAPAAKTAAPAQDTRAESFQFTRESGFALSPCGSVHDSRGRAIAGARITVVNDVSRTARTGPDGSFCLPRVQTGDVLSVLCVGYEPVRITVGTQAAMAVVVEPVGTLGPEAGKVLTPPGTPSAMGQPAAPEPTKSSKSKATAKSSAPSADVYEGSSEAARNAVAAARAAEGVARRENSATAMDSAAVRWDQVTVLVTGAALHDARFRALSLRRQSMSAGPTPERVARFREGLYVFLAQAPRNSPEYSTAQRWQSEIQTGNKALFR